MKCYQLNQLFKITYPVLDLWESGDTARSTPREIDAFGRVSGEHVRTTGGQFVK
jgi:hypothetical protein